MASIKIEDLSANEELTRDELKGLFGGAIELENTLISSYSLSGTDGAAADASVQTPIVVRFLGNSGTDGSLGR
jgi:hypothetical protein